jgi:hypothetical protein
MLSKTDDGSTTLKHPARGGIRLSRAFSALHLVTPSHVKLMSASIPIIARMRNRVIDGSGTYRNSE